MSKLEEIIKEIYQKGVEYKQLKEVADISRGKRVTKKDLSDNGTFPVFQNSLKPLGYYDKANYPAGTTFVICAGAAGEVGFCETNYWGADDCFSILCGDEVEGRYIYHFLLKEQSYLKANVRKASIPRLASSVIANMRVPVPPLEVQREIVRVLDHFTLLSAELSAELKDRKLQYECYRDMFLNPHNMKDATEYALSEIVYYPKDRIEATELHEGNYIGVDNMLQQKMGITRSSLVPKDGKWIKYEKEDVLLGNIRPYLRKIWISDRIGGTNGDVVVFRCKDKKGLYPRFLYHILAAEDFFEYNNNHAKGAKMPRGDKAALLEYRVSIPNNYEEQKRIAKILDAFDSLCNDISAGLPAEIEARQKQYEYYRDKLLSFEEKKEA